MDEEQEYAGVPGDRVMSFKSGTYPEGVFTVQVTFSLPVWASDIIEAQRVAEELVRSKIPGTQL
jgi:hypothetical protein